jgi:SPX domain protein involved in polyphosphate accumulation
VYETASEMVKPHKKRTRKKPLLQIYRIRSTRFTVVYHTDSVSIARSLLIRILPVPKFLNPVQNKPTNITILYQHGFVALFALFAIDRG